MVSTLIGLGLVGFKGGGGHLDMLPADGSLSVERCALFDSVPGPLQSVQRAGDGGVLFLLFRVLLQFIWEVDNLEYVIRRVSGILAGRSGRKPFELCTDGDFPTLIEVIIRQRGSETVRISNDYPRVGRLFSLPRSDAWVLGPLGRRRHGAIDKIGNGVTAADVGLLSFWYA